MARGSLMLTDMLTDMLTEQSGVDIPPVRVPRILRETLAPLDFLALPPSCIVLYLSSVFHTHTYVKRLVLTDTHGLWPVLRWFAQYQEYDPRFCAWTLALAFVREPYLYYAVPIT